MVRFWKSLVVVVALLATLLDVPQVSAQAGWQWPYEGPVAFPVGPRAHHPFDRKSGYHTGIDIVENLEHPERGMGKPIWAARAGWVVAIDDGPYPPARKEDGGGYGEHVVLRHSGGLYSMYAHLSEVEPTLSRGQWVNTGAPLGKMGNTGKTSVAFVHLHFAVCTNDRFINIPQLRHTFINPLTLLPPRSSAARDSTALRR